MLLIRMCDSQAQGETKAVMYTAEATTLASAACVLPQTTRYEIQCQDGGTIRDLSQEEGLDMGSCSLVDQSSMVCIDNELTPSSDGSTNSQIVFACEGTSDSQLRATARVDIEAMDCTQTVLGAEAFSRTISLTAICPTVPGFVQFPSFFDDPECLDGSDVSTVFFCSQQGSCTDTPTGFELPFDQGPCTAFSQLPDAGISVSDAGLSSLQPTCFWNPTQLSSGFSDDGNQPVAADSLEASYEVFLTADSGAGFGGDSCLFADPSEVEVSCGPDGEIASSDLDATEACIRTDASTYQCTFDPNTLRGPSVIGIAPKISCRGVTRSALALDILWDPKEMECTTTGNGIDSATVSYTMLLQQTCNGGNDYANLVGQQCAPITSTNYNAAFNETANVGVGTESCSLGATNCHLAGQCASGTNRQELGRLRVFMPPDMVDVGCAGGATNGEQGAGGGVGPGGGNGGTTTFGSNANSGGRVQIRFLASFVLLTWTAMVLFVA